MESLLVGTRVLVSCGSCKYEGTICTIDDKQNFYRLEKAICVTTGKSHRGLLNVMKEDIVKVIPCTHEPSGPSKGTEPSNGTSPKSPSNGISPSNPISPSNGIESPKSETKLLPNAHSNSCSSNDNICETSDVVIPTAPARHRPCPPIACAVPATSVPEFPSDPLANGFIPALSANKLPAHTLATYKIPDARSTAFGGVTRNEEGEVMNKKDCTVQTESSTLPIDYVIINAIDDLFERAVEELLTKSCVGFAMEGIDIGRRGQLCWIQIAMADRVFLFDILALGDKAFDCGLRAIIESPNVQKVIHDCRYISDMLYHRYKIEIVNVFDTQVADAILYRSHNRGRFPNEVSQLTICLLEHLSIPISQISSHKARECGILKDDVVWSVRPPSQTIIDMAVVRVMYLLELRVRLIEKMLADFTDGVDIYLGLHRDAPTKKLTKMQNHIFLVPPEFLDLSSNAAESRRRAALLHPPQKSASSSLVSTATLARTDVDQFQTAGGAGFSNQPGYQPTRQKSEKTLQNPAIAMLPELDMSDFSIPNPTANPQAAPLGSSGYQAPLISLCGPCNDDELAAIQAPPRPNHHITEFVFVAGGHEDSHMKAQVARECKSKKLHRQMMSADEAIRQSLLANRNETAPRVTSLPGQKISSFSDAEPMRRRVTDAVDKSQHDSSYSSSLANSDDGGDLQDFSIIPSSSDCFKSSHRRPLERAGKNCVPPPFSFYPPKDPVDPVFQGHVAPGFVSRGDIVVLSDAAYSSSDDVEITTVHEAGDRTPSPSHDWLARHSACGGSPPKMAVTHGDGRGDGVDHPCLPLLSPPCNDRDAGTSVRNDQRDGDSGLKTSGAVHGLEASSNNAAGGASHRMNASTASPAGRLSQQQELAGSRSGSGLSGSAENPSGPGGLPAIGRGRQLQMLFARCQLSRPGAAAEAASELP